MRRTKRPIDFGLSNKDQLIVDQQVINNWFISDHLPVIVTFEASKLPSEESKVLFDRKMLENTQIVNGIVNTNYQVSDDILSDITKFYQELNNSLLRLKVLKTIKSNNNLLIPNKIKKAVNAKRLTFLRVRRGLEPADSLIIAQRTLRREINSFKRMRYLKHIKRGIELLKSRNSRESWKWIKSASGKTMSRECADRVYKPNSTIIETDPVEKLNIWSEHFRCLSIKRSNAINNSDMIYSDERYKHITDEPIAWSEILVVLKSLRKGKAAGIDMIPGEVYKLVQNELIPTSNMAKSMLYMLNKVYLENIFPEEWSTCTVVPVFKKGDKADPNNYRGIALINTLLKVLTKVITNRLQTICSDLKLIVREQVGFMKSEECAVQAACLLECCQRRKIRDKDTYLCFLDLKKAYDMVPHDLLIAKLHRVGLGNKMINFIKLMYENTFMRVRIGDKLTNQFKYERGVRQGCPTSPS